MATLSKEEMIHYSCDRCRRLIETENDVRYVVQLEIQAKFGDDVHNEDMDGFLEMDEIIEHQEDRAFDEDDFGRRRFDLCGECYREFIQNPLGREVSKSVGFSDN